MKTLSFPCFLVACGLLALRGLAAEPAGMVARVGDAAVTVDDIRASLDGLAPAEEAALARDPALLSQAVRVLLMQRVVLKEAAAKHWDQQPAVVALIERNRKSAVAESYLQAVSNPPANFPGEAELQSAYEANKAALVIPRQFRLAQIFIALPKDADAIAAANAQARLDAARKSLRLRDADFGAIARTLGDGRENAGRDGEIGWITESRVMPGIRSQVAALGKNAVSEPVRLDDGWHILKCLEVKEAHTAALEEVRGQLAQRLRAERARANREAYLAKLQQQNPVAVNELALSKVLDKAER